MSTRLLGRPTGTSPIVSARHSSFPRAWSPNEARWEPRRGVIPELLLDRTAFWGRQQPASLDKTLIARGTQESASRSPVPQPSCYLRATGCECAVDVAPPDLGDGRCPHSCRAVREGGGEGEGAAWEELTVLIVGGEDNETAAVAHGETHGHGSSGVQERAIERRRCAEDPVTRARAVGAPDARGHGPVAVKAQGSDATAAGGAQSGGECAVWNAVRP